jgi:hypothetical protein
MYYFQAKQRQLESLNEEAYTLLMIQSSGIAFNDTANGSKTKPTLTVISSDEI